MKLKKEIHRRGLVKKRNKLEKYISNQAPFSDSDRSRAPHPKLFNPSLTCASCSRNKLLQSTSLALCETLEPTQRIRLNPAPEASPGRSINVILHRVLPLELGFEG